MSNTKPVEQDNLDRIRIQPNQQCIDAAHSYVLHLESTDQLQAAEVVRNVLTDHRRLLKAIERLTAENARFRESLGLRNAEDLLSLYAERDRLRLALETIVAYSGCEDNDEYVDKSK